MAHFGIFRNMALSFNLGNTMTDSQKQWLINWVKSNLSTPNELEKAATIAWQYELPEDIIEKIRDLKPEESYDEDDWEEY